MGKKRLKFKCWNCERKYSLLRTFTGQEKLFVACPYCNKEAVVDLDPYRAPAVSIYKSGSAAGDPEAQTAELDLPDLLPTRPPNPDEIVD